MISALGLLVGLALGLTGGGGSVIAVPLLVYVVGVPVHAAIAISLATVAVTSLFGVGEGLGRDVVDVRAGLVVAAAGVVTAPLGVYAGKFVADAWLLGAFSVLTLLVALQMGRTALRTPDHTRAVRGALSAESDSAPLSDETGTADRSVSPPIRMAVLIAIGAGVGLVSGFFGVGGGFLIVPSLVRFARLGMHRAVGTSLLVIGCTGLSGLGTSIVAGQAIDFSVLSLFLGGGIIGMWVGRQMARRLAGATLQLLFAIALVAMAAAILVAHVHGALA